MVRKHNSLSGKIHGNRQVRQGRIYILIVASTMLLISLSLLSTSTLTETTGESNASSCTTDTITIKERCRKK